MQEAELKQSNLSFLWLIPLGILALVLWMAYQHIVSTGPTITITFNTGEGIIAGKTKIRYKDLDVGTVTGVAFSKDLSTVIVDAQMIANATPLLTTNSQFWVVRPQISAAGVSGLSTLISGSYIALDPGTGDEREYAFTGLEEAPAIQPSEQGLRLKLEAYNASGINVGTPIYYRGIKVGQVGKIKYQSDNDRVSIDVFIREPYDKLISVNTKFWNISGINFDVGLNGAAVEMDSVETLLLGGITFSTPTSFNINLGQVGDDTIFTLYASESQTVQPPSFEKHYYVLYFEDSIRGLSTGAPVAFNGIDIGQVIDIRLLYDEKLKKAAIPVLIELEPQRIDLVNRVDDEQHNIIASLVAQGLQASLETDSLLTGAKFIKLAIYPDDIRGFSNDAYSVYEVMPSRSTGFAQITDGVNEIIDKVKNLPFDELLNEAKLAVNHVNNIIGSAEMSRLGATIKDTLDGFNQTMRSIRSVGDNAALTLQALNQQLNQVIAQFEDTLYGISPESSLYYTLQETLNALQQTARSVDRIANKLNEKPNALIFGN